MTILATSSSTTTVVPNVQVITHTTDLDLVLEHIPTHESIYIYFAGTLVTASAHIITAVIGSGVLSLAWALAQLGWIAGPIVLFVFALITWFCSILLADCYRSSQGKRSYSYKDAVRSNLGNYIITSKKNNNSRA